MSTYAEQIAQDSIESRHFVVIRPRISVPYTDFTLVTGTIYSSVCQYGYVTGVIDKDNVYTRVAGTPGLNEFSYDHETRTVLVNPGGAPSGSSYFVFTFEWHFSNEEVLWHRDPTDTASDVVQWHGVLTMAPHARFSSSSRNFGFFPIESTNFTVINDKAAFNLGLHYASFNRIECDSWHSVGPLDAETTTQILSMLVTGVEGNSEDLMFQLTDRFINFDRKISYLTDPTYYESANFNLPLDPNYEFKPVRLIYGHVRGFVPVNITFNSEDPAGGDNNGWVVGTRRDQSSLYNSPILSRPAANQAVLATGETDNYWVGQWVKIVNGGSPYRWQITDITGDTITFNTNYSASAVGATSTAGIWKHAVRELYWVHKSQLLQDVVYYRRLYFADSLEEDAFQPLELPGTNYLAFALGIGVWTSGFGNVQYFQPLTDNLIAHVDGVRVRPTIAGGNFPVNGKPFITNGVEILYDILINVYGMSESQIDTDSFIAASQASDWPLSFAIGESSTDEMPTFSEVINKILLTLMLKAYFAPNGKLTLVPSEPLGTADASVLTEDIMELQFDYKSEDLAEILPSYNYQEKQIVQVGAGTPDNENSFKVLDNVYDGVDDSVENISDATKYLHGVTKRTRIDTYLAHPDYITFDIDAYMARVRAVYGDREGRFRLVVKNQLYNLGVGSVVSLESENLPGFDYAPGTRNTRSFTVVEIAKKGPGVEVLLDDQKGIEDNAGDF